MPAKSDSKSNKLDQVIERLDAVAREVKRQGRELKGHGIELKKHGAQLEKHEHLLRQHEQKIGQQGISLTQRIEQQGIDLTQKIEHQRIELTQKIDKLESSLVLKFDESVNKMFEFWKRHERRIDRMEEENKQFRDRMLSIMDGVANDYLLFGQEKKMLGAGVDRVQHELDAVKASDQHQDRKISQLESRVERLETGLSPS